ncbi:TPA: DUF4760 domain-containing protein [Legionella anisa]
MNDWKDKFLLFARLCLVFFITLILLLLIIWPLENHYINVIADTNKLESAAEHFNAAAIVILTIIIFCAGWIQFKDLNKTSKGDFLLRIDEKYGQPENIKARTIIHEFYCLTRSEHIDVTNHVRKISIMVKDTKYKIEEAEKFVCLLNFLDFLETISYFANHSYISEKEVNELIGCSLKYYFCVFDDLIRERRQKYNSNHYYSELETLAKKIQKSNPDIHPKIII